VRGLARARQEHGEHHSQNAAFPAADRQRFDASFVSCAESRA
jgi:hypothetical protein